AAHGRLVHRQLRAAAERGLVQPRQTEEPADGIDVYVLAVAGGARDRDVRKTRSEPVRRVLDEGQRLDRLDTAADRGQDVGITRRADQPNPAVLTAEHQAEPEPPDHAGVAVLAVGAHGVRRLVVGGDRLQRQLHGLVLAHPLSLYLTLCDSQAIR